MTEFVKRNDFVDEYHQPITYTSVELVDKPEEYFIDGEQWDGGTSGKDVSDKHEMDVYFFWREIGDDSVEVLLEVYEPIEAVAYCTLRTGLEFASSPMIEHIIYAEKLDAILSDLRQVVGL